MLMRWPLLQLVLLFSLLVIDSDATASSGSLRRRLIDSEGIPIPETPESVYDVIQSERDAGDASPSPSPVELAAAEVPTGTKAQPVETMKPVDPPTNKPKPPPTPSPVDETAPPVPPPTKPPSSLPPPTKPPSSLPPPTNPPVKAPDPTSAPTNKRKDTDPPVAIETKRPSPAPSAIKVADPTAQPTEATVPTPPPSKPPHHRTEAPSFSPSKHPHHHAESPSESPTKPPRHLTEAPSQSPTKKPHHNTPQPVAAVVPVTGAPSAHKTEHVTEPPSRQIDSSPSNDDYDGNAPWIEPTKPPVPYVPPEGDDILVDEKTASDWSTPNESIQQMEHDRNVLIALLTVFGVMLLFSIIVAHQMLNNPDGFCASLCRLVTRCTCCIMGAICFPCRMLGCFGGIRRQPGHMRMGTVDDFSHDLELS